MSEPNEPQNGLGAELRGRIAETLFRLYGPHLGYADVTWDQIDQELWLEVANAVIRELEAIPFTDQIDRSGVRYPLFEWTSSDCPDYLKKWIADE